MHSAPTDLAMNTPIASTATAGSPSRSKTEWILLGVALLATALLYLNVIDWMVRSWYENSDYSHGFLVPFFAAYILYSNRRQLTAVGANNRAGFGLILGIGLIVVALVLRGWGYYTRVMTYEAVSMLPFLMGVFVLCLGGNVLRWSFAPLCFLLFMIPLPGAVSTQLAGFLQMIATQVSTFSLQLMGFTAFAEGNVISLGNGQIGVAEACSGLRMLYSFFALTAGACLMIDRTWIEKVIIALAAIPIAIIANCIRIIATGIAFQYFDSETAEHFFHDIAGWLMMPLGFLLLLGLLAFLDRALVVEQPEPDFA